MAKILPASSVWQFPWHLKAPIKSSFSPHFYVLYHTQESDQDGKKSQHSFKWDPVEDIENF